MTDVDAAARERWAAERGRPPAPVPRERAAVPSSLHGRVREFAPADAARALRAWAPQRGERAIELARAAYLAGEIGVAKLEARVARALGLRRM